MKKLILTIAATLVTVAVFAQGTVTFNNTAFNKVSLGVQGSASATWTAAPTVLQTYRFGLLYGIGQSTSLSLAPSFGVNSTSVTGIIADPANNSGQLVAFQIPGTVANQTDVWIQIIGYNYQYAADFAAARAAALDNTGTHYFGQTAVINAGPLGASKEVGS